jgi:hypothetical protein
MTFTGISRVRKFLSYFNLVLFSCATCNENGEQAPQRMAEKRQDTRVRLHHKERSYIFSAQSLSKMEELDHTQHGPSIGLVVCNEPNPHHVAARLPRTWQ